MSIEKKTKLCGKVVLTYGTFDLFHIGHLNLLRNLKALGATLVVGVSTDEFNSAKGKKTIIPYEQRAQIVGAMKFVDAVFPEYSWDQKRIDITRLDVDIFAMGDDWVGKFDNLSDLCEVIYLPRTKDVSTTEIKNLVQQQVASKIDEIQKTAGTLHELIHNLAS